MSQQSVESTHRSSEGQFARAITDIARALQSPIEAGARLRQVLGSVREVVPSDRCALLWRRAGGGPVTIAHPDDAVATDPGLTTYLTNLLESIECDVDATRWLKSGEHVALPIVSIDEIIGLLYVERRHRGSYDEQHVAVLSVIASQLGAFLTTVRLHDQIQSQAEQLTAQEQQLREANRQLHQVLNQLPAGVMLVDSAGTIRFLNELSRSMLDACEDRSVFNDCPMFDTDGHQYNRADHPLAQAMSSGEMISNREVWIHDRAGRSRVLLANAGPIHISGAQGTTGILAFIDITERKHAERNALRLAAVVEGSDDAIISMDLDGVIESWNRGAQKIFGFTSAAMAGQPTTAIIPEDRHYEEKEILARIRSGRAVENFETVRCRQNGGLVDVALTMSPVKTPDGKIIGASKIARDISQQKRLIAAVRELSFARSVEDVSKVVKESARQLTGADGVTFVLRRGDECYYADEEAIAPLWKGRSFPMADCISGWVLQRGVPVVIPDVYSDSRIPQSVYRQTFVKSLMMVPAGEVNRVAAIGAYWAHHHTATEGQVNALQALADSAALALDNVRLYEDLQRSLENEQTARARAEDHAGTIETLHRVGTAVAAELTLERVVQSVTDAATNLTGAAFGAFFYNSVDASGDAYMLYSLSGAPKEAFAQFPHPRNTQLFGPTFRGEGVVRLDDVTKDPRYGKNPPHNGMPKHHLPVRSYLAVPVQNRTGEILGGLFFGHPNPAVFTERHEQLAIGIASWAAVAHENATLYRKAQEANRMKDEFLAVLSHELRTPLSAMLLWAKMLVDKQVPADRIDHALASIDRNARAQSKLVEDLLDFSAIIQGKLRLNLEPIDLAAVAGNALDAVKSAADAKGIGLEVSAAGPACVMGDAGRLQQVLWNLLSNAVKFTPNGGRVTVEIGRTDSKAMVRIIDTGDGIDSEFLPHVFERFRQADNTAKRAHGGLGLGLAIVRQLVEAHGGTVAADSRGASQGSTFTIVLPLTADRPNKDQSAATVPVNFETKLKNIKVLVVDDDSDARELLTIALGRFGATVVTGSSAAEAVTAIDTQRPDILVTDIGMPHVDGYELLRLLRADSRLRGSRLPAIAVTAYAATRDREEALDAGFNRHIAKPINPLDLADAIESLVRRKNDR